jgi:hypothetical protein
MPLSRLLLILTLLTAGAAAETRVFVSLAGSLLQAEITAVSGDTVSLKRAGDGQILPVKINTLCREDRAYISRWAGQESPAGTAAPLPLTAAAPAPMQTFSIACQVLPSKSTRVPADGGPRSVEVSYSFNITNRELQRHLENGKGVVVVLAKDETNRDGNLIVVQKELFDVTLRAQSKITHTTQPVILAQEQGAAPAGVRTHGYVLLIMDSEERVLYSHSSPTGNTAYAGQIMSITEVPCIIDRDFKVLKDAPVPTNYISF